MTTLARSQSTVNLYLHSINISIMPNKSIKNLQERYYLMEEGIKGNAFQDPRAQDFETIVVAVYDYLILKGISANKLTHSGFGLSQPIDTNDTDAGRANNRRTEFRVVGN